MKRVFVSAFAAGVILASGTSAQEAPRPHEPIAPPRWLQKPTGDQMGDAYPSLAANQHVGGRATMSCAVTNDGEIKDCAVIPGTEAPEGYGFGKAALSVARYFRMAPGRSDGGGTVTIPIVFKYDGEANPRSLQPRNSGGSIF